MIPAFVKTAELAVTLIGLVVSQGLLCHMSGQETQWQQQASNKACKAAPGWLRRRATAATLSSAEFDQGELTVVLLIDREVRMRPSSDRLRIRAASS